MKKSKQFIAFLLSLMLIMTMIPSLSFAMNENEKAEPQEQTQVTDEEKNYDNAESLDVTQDETGKKEIDDAAEKAKKVDEIISVKEAMSYVYAE